MTDIVSRAAIGVALSLAIALFAARRGSLSRSGAAAALVIGTLIYVGGGAPWFSCLLAFFVSSTLLGKVGRARKAAIKREFEKGDTRDAWQALSNGGAAALCGLGVLLLPDPRWAGAFVGALATANGDTWATELGTLSRAEPISLTRLRRVPRGSSGAVSLLGLAATALGGGAVGLVAALNPQAFALGGPRLVSIGVVGGVLGSLLDSLLGASLQGTYRCPRCATPTEGRLHHCGSRADLTRGFTWLDNDLVNLTATLFGAALGAALAS